MRKKSNLTKQVWARLHPTEQEELDNYARAANMTRAAAIRFLVLYSLGKFKETIESDAPNT